MQELRDGSSMLQSETLYRPEAADLKLKVKYKGEIALVGRAEGNAVAARPGLHPLRLVTTCSPHAKDRTGEKIERVAAYRALVSHAR